MEKVKGILSYSWSTAAVDSLAKAVRSKIFKALFFWVETPTYIYIYIQYAEISTTNTQTRYKRESNVPAAKYVEQLAKYMLGLYVCLYVYECGSKQMC